MEFQSTHPVWGATITEKGKARFTDISIHAPRVGCDARHTAIASTITDFNPRTPCGVRRQTSDTRYTKGRYFNPRTPCGVRHAESYGIAIFGPFQSTHPVWGATHIFSHFYNLHNISIHAPRVGCDASPQGQKGSYKYFNPRTPCGVRLVVALFTPLPLKFQSTHPVWGATSGLIPCAA